MIKSNFKIKAMSGIIATSLLLLVTITMYIAFQIWHTNYSNDILNDFDQISHSDIIFEKLNYNDLYIKNLANIDLKVTNIKIEGVSCNVQGYITRNNLTRFDLDGCVIGMDPGLKNIVLFSDKGIFSARKIHKNELTGRLIAIYNLGTSCPIDYTKFYALEYLTNSHAEISSQNLYTYSLCIKHIDFTIVNSCAATLNSNMLYLDGATNAHVYTQTGTSLDPITNQICLGSNDISATDINITYTSTNLASQNFTCLGSLELDNMLGGHAGDCEAYPTKIWAKIE